MNRFCLCYAKRKKKNHFQLNLFLLRNEHQPHNATTEALQFQSKISQNIASQTYIIWFDSFYYYFVLNIFFFFFQFYLWKTHLCEILSFDCGLALVVQLFFFDSVAKHKPMKRRKIKSELKQYHDYHHNHQHDRLSRKQRNEDNQNKSVLHNLLTKKLVALFCLYAHYAQCIPELRRTTKKTATERQQEREKTWHRQRS